MRYGNYNPEKNVKGNQDVYIKAGLFGIVCAIVFIGGGKLLIRMFNAMIKYWIWIVAIIGGGLLIKKFFFSKKTNG